MSKTDKPTVFVSYSHLDEERWKNPLLQHLLALQNADRILVWDDSKIDTGADWYPEIEQAIQQTDIAICLLTANYLASDFCTKEEVPALLTRREQDGMVLIPVLCEPCTWQAFGWRKIQVLPRGQSILEKYHGKESIAFHEVAQTILQRLADRTEPSALTESQEGSGPEWIDTSRLPVTGDDLFGRAQELAFLDRAWEAPDTQIVSLVGWGGVGKSTLINRWIRRMAENNYRGARHVYSWSFHSQGVADHVGSADQFIAAALKRFGDPAAVEGSPWERGERLARRVSEQRSLLILDGLEPLQSAFREERGRITDPALATMLSRLPMMRNEGLCLITTREHILDLRGVKSAIERDLEQISPEAGRTLLRTNGIHGTDQELQELSADFGNHALALRLLSTYLQTTRSDPILAARQIPDLAIPARKGRHPRRLLRAFESKLTQGAELQALCLLGFFDRPAEFDALAALRRFPPIQGLTDAIVDDASWQHAILPWCRRDILFRRQDGDRELLDVHPIVREHFSNRLQTSNREAWRKGNERLFEHYRKTSVEKVDSIEDLAPLYAAVSHGCDADRHQEALEDVYAKRISAFKQKLRKPLRVDLADLASLAHFFDPPWKKLVSELPAHLRAFVRGEAGERLRSVGRIAEAAEAIQGALDAATDLENWPHAAIYASTLCELHLQRGRIDTACAMAKQGMAYAESTGDRFQGVAQKTRLAEAEHQAGRLGEAGRLFEEAEEEQRKWHPGYALLFGADGFRYCAFLLDRGQHRDVRRRAIQSLRRLRTSGILLPMALDRLSLGQAHQLNRHYSAAQAEFQEALTGLRESGRQDELSRGLLAQASLRLDMGSLELARSNIDEVIALSSRTGLRLFQADAYLLETRLHLRQGNRSRARESLAMARAIIEETGFYRREESLLKLQDQAS
jgi:tetratricopeptide (TPR) repeat protein